MKIMGSKMTIIRGDDYNMAITLRDKDKEPIDITNCTLFFTVKKKSGIKRDDDEQYIIKKDITQHIDAEAWKTALILTKEETDVDIWVFVYDFQLKTVWGEIHSTTRWEFEVKEDITKRTTI